MNRYVLWAYSERKETTLPFFVYFEGAFRYLGMLHPASGEDFQKSKAPGGDRTTPCVRTLPVGRPTGNEKRDN
jgi:hypothetical protein